MTFLFSNTFRDVATVAGWATLGIVLLLVWQVSQLSACFAVIVGRDASADGAVLVGHNEENRGRQMVNFRRVPRRRFPPGTTLRLRRGGQLEEVEETWAFLWREIPGLEFSDGFLNERGVAIVSDSCPSREDDYDALVAAGEIRSGGIGSMLRRVVAERARSARDGVRLAGRLIDRFGYVHSGRTYVIADRTEAWLLAVVRGRHWVARRVPDDDVVVLPNVHVIDEVDLSDGGNFLGSADLIEYAVSRGWFDPECGEPFSFRTAYSADGGETVDLRRWRGQQLLLGSPAGEQPQGPLPFAVTPARKLSVAALTAILRDREGPLPLFKQGTQESAVFQLRTAVPAEIGCVYWRTTGRPDTSVYTPWYVGITETPEQYSLPIPPEKQFDLENRFNPPEDVADAKAALAWQTFQRLQEVIDEDYATRSAVACPVWAQFEDRLFERQQSVEAEALALWRSDPQAARAYLTRYCADTSVQACAEASRLVEAFSF